MGLFDGIFDLNFDGRTDDFEAVFGLSCILPSLEDDQQKDRFMDKDGRGEDDF